MFPLDLQYNFQCSQIEMTVYLRVTRLVVEGNTTEDNQIVNIEWVDNQGKGTKLRSVNLTASSRYQNPLQVYTALSTKKTYQISLSAPVQHPPSAALDIQKWISSFKGNKDTLLHQKVEISGKVSAELQFRYDKNRQICGGSQMAVLPSVDVEYRSKLSKSVKPTGKKVNEDSPEGDYFEAKLLNLEKGSGLKGKQSQQAQTPKKSVNGPQEANDTGFKQSEDQRMDKGKEKDQIKEPGKHKVMPIFLGACQNKNLFSCLDSKVEEDRTFSIVQPTYR